METAPIMGFNYNSFCDLCNDSNGEEDANNISKSKSNNYSEVFIYNMIQNQYWLKSLSHVSDIFPATDI
eukprot:Pgem_evm1s16422